MNLADLVDAAVEVPLAPSFTRLGYDIRSRADHWRPLDSYDMTGRVVMITGATSGLGLAAARQLAAMGASVVLVGRDPAKTRRVRDEITDATGNEQLTAVIADLGDLGAVRDAAVEVRSTRPRLDVLIHNAGALDPERHTTDAGIEATVAAQVVGPFLLTGLLLDRLIDSAPARVLTMSSGGMYATALDVDHLEMDETDYRGSEQYARAKRAQVTLNELWSERFAARGVVFHAVHPGWADTPGVERSLPRFHTVVGPLLRTPEQGSDTLVWLAADDGEPLMKTGRFWLDRRPRAVHRLPGTRRSDTPDERTRLWDWCVEHAGIDP